MRLNYHAGKWYAISENWCSKIAIQIAKSNSWQMQFEVPSVWADYFKANSEIPETTLLPFMHPPDFGEFSIARNMT
jgi:hypothetical protein